MDTQMQKEEGSPSDLCNVFLQAQLQRFTGPTVPMQIKIILIF